MKLTKELEDKIDKAIENLLDEEDDLIGLEEIPVNQTDDFPEGVSEVEFNTEAEMDAFKEGLHYADDIDVESSIRFPRNGKWVCRVKVGNW